MATIILEVFDRDGTRVMQMALQSTAEVLAEIAKMGMTLDYVEPGRNVDHYRGSVCRSEVHYA